MIRTLRAYFLSRLLREKLLLVALVAVGAVIWISSFSSRAGLLWRGQKVTTTELKDQDRWLRDRPRVEAAAQKAAAQLDPAKTLDGTRLFTTVRQLALDNGLRNITNNGLTPLGSNGQFSVNTLGVTITANDPNGEKNWESLTNFYKALQTRSPYVAIDQVILTPMRGNSGQLSLFLKVSSVEIH
ncbi:MAG: hypothetical protein RIQ93_1881 [Verrucomicrobiota bacterium]|jgi:hypothetical protein